MSNIRINYLSYRVVPLVKNGNTPVLGNNPYRVGPISAVNTNVGYNSNNPNNGSEYIFMKELKKETEKNDNMEPDKGNHIDIRI